MQAPSFKALLAGAIAVTAMVSCNIAFAQNRHRPSPSVLPGSVATTAAPDRPMSGYVIMTPQDLPWTDAPPAIPRGAKIATIEGDLTKPGPYTVRMQLPANWLIGAHTHPGVEHLTVISGSAALGMGDQFDESKLMALPAGTVAVLQPGMAHFLQTKEPTILQMHGMGPFGIKYVNPRDDPSQQ